MFNAALCRQYSADAVSAELVKTMAVHAMKELFGQVSHTYSAVGILYVVGTQCYSCCAPSYCYSLNVAVVLVFSYLSIVARAELAKVMFV